MPVGQLKTQPVFVVLSIVNCKLENSLDPSKWTQSQERDMVQLKQKGYCHKKPSKEEHEDEVCSPATEGAFL